MHEMQSGGSLLFMCKNIIACKMTSSLWQEGKYVNYLSVILINSGMDLEICEGIKSYAFSFIISTSNFLAGCNFLTILVNK